MVSDVIGVVQAQTKPETERKGVMILDKWLNTNTVDIPPGLKGQRVRLVIGEDGLFTSIEPLPKEEPVYSGNEMQAALMQIAAELHLIRLTLQDNQRGRVTDDKAN